MSTQYLRKCTLVIGDQNGSGLDFSELRCVFNIKKADSQTPNSAVIKIYNVNKDTAQKVINEFTDISLQAGYVDNFGVIFKGVIKLSTYGREEKVNTVLTIYAADGDVAYNQAVISQTLAAGATQNTIIAEAKKTMPSIDSGFVPELKGESLPRGKVMFGMTRDVMRAVALTTETTWSIQDGFLQFVKLNSYLPGQAVVLNSGTGLIGAPEQTTEGVKLQCLINPFLKIGGLIKLNNSDIVRAAPVEAIKPEKNKTENEESKKEADKEKADKEKAEEKKNATLNLDGVYRILTVEYDGDSHGQNWYANLLCLNVDESAPADKKVRNT